MPTSSSGSYDAGTCKKCDETDATFKERAKCVENAGGGQRHYRRECKWSERYLLSSNKWESSLDSGACSKCDQMHSMNCADMEDVHCPAFMGNMTEAEFNKHKTCTKCGANTLMRDYTGDKAAALETAYQNAGYKYRLDHGQNEVSGAPPKGWCASVGGSEGSKLL